MDFITGRTGSPHVTSQQFRGILEGIYGSDSYLAGIYDNLAYSIQPANTIQISSGLLIHHGGAFLVPNGSVDEVVYENGTQGTKRIDLIVARYTKDAETDTESAEWVIIKGTETTGTPVAPDYTVGNMQNGDLVDDCPVYAVNFDGLNITGLDLLVPTSGVAVTNTLGAGAHNAIYRGKNLGSTVTANQWAAIKAGTFDNLYIGDYWTINDVTWVIAGFDYWYNTALHKDPPNNQHHIAMIPLTSLYSAPMNSPATTTGGYAGSQMVSTGLTNALSQVQSAFGGEHILQKSVYFTTEMDNGVPSKGDWFVSQIEIMSEEMVAGCNVVAPMNSQDFWEVQKYHMGTGRLPLFSLAPWFINVNDTNWWLRDFVKTNSCSFVTINAGLTVGGTYASHGVRPIFAIYQA